MYARFLLALLPFLLVFASCSDDKSKEIPDVSGINVAVKIERMELALAALDTNQMEAALEEWKARYPDFAAWFLQFGPLPPDGPSDAARLRVFLTHPEVRHLMDTLQQRYPKLTDIEAELSQAMRYYKYYFPRRPIPRFYSYLSMYSYAAPVAETFVGVGLDFFLGARHPTYGQTESLRPMYIQRTLNKQHLTATVIAGIADDVVGPPAGNTMLDLMINNGKKLYVASCLLPTEQDSIILGWSGAQTQYWENAEASLYKFLIDQNLLYSTNFRDFRNYLQPGPFEPDAGLPGNSGSWLGLQMVRRYVERSDAQGMEAMLRETNAQRFLQRYKPR
jgi:hypothetical protein